MKQLTQCPICLGGNLQVFLHSSDHFLTKESFTIARCSDCGFRFTNPRPDDMDLGTYYKSEEYISHSDTSKGLMSVLYKAVRNFTLWQKERYLRRFVSRGTLLDFGTGTGCFPSFCKSKGWKAVGYEPDMEAANIGRNRGLQVYSVDLKGQFDFQPFDVISLWHVLEHLPALRETLATLSAKLKQNGFMFVAVPNPESYDARYYGKFWAAYDLPRHLYHFSKSNIESLFVEHNFELIDTKPMYFDSFYVSMLSEKYKAGKSKFFHALWVGLISNIKAARSGEYSSRIYVFRKKS